MTVALAPPKVRQAELTDLGALIALEALFPPGEQIAQRSWRRFLGRVGCVWVSLDGAGVIVAAGVVLFRKGTRSARLYSLVTAPSARGQGHARAVLSAIEGEVRRRGLTGLRLEVHIDNAHARALYATRGFEPVGHKPAYYCDGGDAIVMHKRIAVEGTPDP